MKKQILAGLIILIPLSLTIMIFLFVMRIFTDPFLALFSHIMQDIFPTQTAPVLLTIAAYISSLFFVLLLIYLLGLFARLYFFKMFLKKAHVLFIKIPLVKSIFHVSRDVVKVFLSPKSTSAFSTPVLVPFSTPKNYVMALALQKNHPKIAEKLPGEITTVFFPTAPHPISGFLAYVPSGLIKKVDKSNEEAIKFIISCGILQNSYES